MSDTERQPVEVTGVVYPPGADGGRIGQEEGCTLDFVLRPWRGSEGPLDERELAVSQPGLTEEVLDTAMDEIVSFEILRLRVYLDPASPEAESLRAELVEVQGRESSDAELTRRVADLQAPVTVEDPFFGTVTFDRSLNWWEKQTEWDGATVQPVLRLAETLRADAGGRDRRVRNYATEELIELKNDTWLEDDEEELTEDEFRQRMTLDALEVRADERFEFTYDDGGLFWGHVIQVSGTLAEGPKRAGIAG